MSLAWLLTCGNTFPPGIRRGLCSGLLRAAAAAPRARGAIFRSGNRYVSNRYVSWFRDVTEKGPGLGDSAGALLRMILLTASRPRVVVRDALLCAPLPGSDSCFKIT